MGELEPGRKYGLKTRLVRGGLKRSPNGETSEALYLTSGYAYDSAEIRRGPLQGRRSRASCTRASAIRPSRCSKNAWR